MLHFVPAPAHKRFEVEVTDSSVGALPGEVRATVHATRDGRPLRQARVSFAGATARTDKEGIATVSTMLERPGRFKALAQNGQNYGVSELVPVGVAPSALGVPAPQSAAG